MRQRSCTGSAKNDGARGPELQRKIQAAQMMAGEKGPRAETLLHGSVSLSGSQT